MIHQAVILSTGDEITTGRIVDTNSNYIADKLAEVGIEVAAVLTVGDVPERLEWAWKTAMAMADVVISTGGIGPTADDLTNETVARITGKKLRARSGKRRPHETHLRVDQPRDAREQSQTGRPAGNLGGRSQPARYGTGLPHGGAAGRRPHLSPGRAAGRAARDETDDGGQRPPVAQKATAAATRSTPSASSRPSASASRDSTRRSPD